MMQPYRVRTWSEIDLDAITKNYNIIKMSTDAKICCVIKANGYGHGAVELAKLYEELGTDFLAVSNIEEALQLRNNQIATPILILGYTRQNAHHYYLPIILVNVSTLCNMLKS